MSAKSLEASHRPPIETPLTTARIEMPDGSVEYVWIPKGFDILLEWNRFKDGHKPTKNDSHRFLAHLEKKGVKAADEVVECILSLE